MLARTFLALIFATTLATVVGADTTIVDENFDSYLDQAAFEAAWQPDEASPVGVLIPGPDPNSLGLTPPNQNPPNIEGQAVNILNDINEYVAGGGLPAGVKPGATQNVRLSADFFDDAVGNKRDTVGLRGAGAENLIELGFYNADGADPVDPNVVVPTTDYAYRLVLFGGLGGDLVQAVNWNYFQLDPSLDFNDNGLANPADIGAGWHTFSVEVSPTDVTVSLDLFRDGLTNTAVNDPNFTGPDPNFGPGNGTPGVDASATWPLIAQDVDFASLRIGAPSSLTSANETVVDNVLLELIDVGVPTDDADFDGDGLVTGLDFLIWQRNIGTPDAQPGDGDANGDMIVNGDDLTIWETQYGGPPPLAAISAVPEPLSATMFLVACGCWTAFARRKSR